MRTQPTIRFAATAALLLCAALSTGCRHYYQARALYQPPPAVAPLGTVSQPIWQSQEARAEASDFVVYQHSWGYQSTQLNSCGMNHLTQIAARLQYCPDLPVIVEPTNMADRPETTEFDYPVHPDPELDLRRREVVVLALEHMGVPNAEKRVVVAPALAWPANAVEATQAYNQGLSGAGAFGGGGGGFGGGGFGGGGFGFGGGGGVF